ncbi:MAG TPA: hypothetical protein VGM32_13695 [Rhodopila sp.]|jgi:hypothetical protein
MPNAQFIERIWVRIGQIGDHQIGTDDIRHHAISDHSGIGIIVGPLYMISKLVSFEDVFHEEVEQKIRVISLNATIFANRSNHEAKRALCGLGGNRQLECHGRSPAAVISILRLQGICITSGFVEPALPRNS